MSEEVKQKVYTLVATDETLAKFLKLLDARLKKEGLECLYEVAELYNVITSAVEVQPQEKENG